MPNLAAVLRTEICRLAKREIKSATGPTKQAVAQFRRDIARLKRELGTQAKEIAFLKGQERNAWACDRQRSRLKASDSPPARSRPSEPDSNCPLPILESWLASRD